MMRRLIKTAAMLSFLLAGACASYPNSTVSQGTAPGMLAFPGAAPGQRVLIDGVDAGEAAAYDGADAILTVTPGRHAVQVVSGGQILLSQTLVVAAGARIDLRVP